MAGIYNASALGKDTKPGKVNNASMYDLQTLMQAGIDPKTGLPVKMSHGLKGYKENIKANLRIIDEQDAVNRYK